MNWADIIKIADEFGEEEGEALFRQIEHLIQLLLDGHEKRVFGSTCENCLAMNSRGLPKKILTEVEDAEENIDALREYVEDLLRSGKWD